MNAKPLATKLSAAGFTIGAVTEPTSVEDGMIVITTKVHVQVPLSGNSPNVVRENADGTMTFHPIRPRFTTLIRDIKEACGVGEGEPRGEVIGGIFCGNLLGAQLYAEEVASCRWMIRKQVAPDFAQRLGEVMGSNGRFQALRCNGNHVGIARTLDLAATMLAGHQEQAAV